MIRLFIFLLAMTAVGVAASWLAQHPGNVTIFWFDYRIDTSFAVLLALALASAVLMAILYLVLNAIINAPRRFATSRNLKHYRQGLSEITYSIAALAASDTAAAEQHTKKAQKLIGETPLTILLSAQVARSQGDDERTSALLERLLDHRETEYLAARSLSEAASKQRLLPRALLLAERAVSVNPKARSAVLSVVSLHTQASQWQEALLALARNRQSISRSDTKRFRGLIHLEQSRQVMAKGRADIALPLAKVALRELPGFVPAIIHAAQAYAACGQPTKGVKLLLGAWKRSAHAEIAQTLEEISMAHDSKEKQIKTIRRLAHIRGDHPESHLALAHILLRQRDFSAARKSLREALDKEETARACALMAELEQSETGDFDASTHWRNRALSALPDLVWSCTQCGTEAKHYVLNCTSCHSLDSLVWQRETPSVV